MVTVIPYHALIETLTFLFTDIEGSTLLLRRLGDRDYSRLLEDHHRLIRDSLLAYEGREQGTQGDSFFATFTSPSHCVACAVDIQRSFDKHDWPTDAAPRVRMGIHTGEASDASTGLVGYEVHRAARIAAVGHGGQVLLSGASAGLVEDSLPFEVSLRDLGSHRLKDLGRPETIFQLVGEGLQDNFAPLTSLDNPELPNNLPASLNPFVGRTRELDEIRQLVSESRLITLTGSGGSGKTRLALQVAAESLDGAGDGVWFVDLAPVSDPEQTPLVLIAALQLSENDGLSDSDRLLRALKDQDAMIVFDNCEHVIDAVAKLADSIVRHCPRVVVIATSREPLGVDGEHVYRVRSLSLPSQSADRVSDLEGSEAVRLFLTRTQSHDSTFTLTDAVAPLVASICRRLDGIPLAIELAASRMSSMSIQDLHDRLDQRFRLLTGGSRNALPRQQTLSAMVAWSYDLLSEREREALRRLSVFVGGFDLRAAEAVSADDELLTFDVADLLSALVNKSLIGAERTATSFRYRLLETIRQFAADQLIQVGGDEETLHVRDRHAQYYLSLCEEAAPAFIGPNQGVWMKQLDVEWDNVLTAFGRFASEGRFDLVLRMGIALMPYLETRQPRAVAHFMIDALASFKGDTPQFEARATLAVARVRAMVSRDETARTTQLAMIDTVIATARELHDEHLEAEALVASTMLGLAQIGYEEATRRADAALEIATRLNDANLMGFALITRGLCYQNLGEGRQFHERALDKLRQAGNLAMVCTALVVTSLSRGLYEGDLEETKELSEEALKIAEEIGSTTHDLMLSSNLGVVLCLLGQFEESEKSVRHALIVMRRLGRVDAETMPWCLFALACSATSSGEYVRGAVLTGAHETLHASQIGPASDYWSPPELVMRESNRNRLLEVLGEDEWSRLFAYGAELSSDRVVDLALRRSEITV